MARLAALVCVVLGVGLGGKAGADEASELVEARRHLEALEYQEAASVLERLLRRGGSERAGVVRAYELLAAAAASSGEEAQAVWAYQRLLALEPRYRSPGEPSPRLAGALARAREELPAGAVVQVRLDLGREVIAGRPLTGSLVARSDALGLVRGVKLRIGRSGRRAVSSVTARGAPPVEFVVPAAATAGAGTQLSIEAAALDEHGNAIAAAAPVLVSVVARPSRRPGRDPPPPSREPSAGVLGQWWFWTGVVVLAAGAVVAGVVLFGSAPDCPGSSVCYDTIARVAAGAWR